MSKLERDQSSWNDQELDSVLSQFFQKEMPEELRKPSVPVEISKHATPMKKGRQQTGLFSIFAVTAVMLLIVSVVWKPFRNPENSEPVHLMPGVSQPISDSTHPRIPAASDILTRPSSLNYLFSSSLNSSEYTQFVSETVEQYETPEGPVEQRNTYYTSKKIVVDPQTGLGVTLTIPELQIDIRIDLDALEIEQLSDDQ